MKGEVKKLRVVPDKRFGWPRSGNIVPGINLVKIFEDRRLLPDFVVELPVDYRRFIEARNADGPGFIRRHGDEVFAGA